LVQEVRLEHQQRPISLGKLVMLRVLVLLWVLAVVLVLILRGKVSVAVVAAVQEMPVPTLALVFRLKATMVVSVPRPTITVVVAVVLVLLVQPDRELSQVMAARVLHLLSRVHLSHMQAAVEPVLLLPVLLDRVVLVVAALVLL
jgi:hypothetical protein